MFCLEIPMHRSILLTLFCLFTTSIVKGQSGPAGVQNTSNVPGPVFWIKADGDITESSGNISSWNDEVSTNNAVLGGSDPLLSSNQINGRPSVFFDGNDYLTIPNSTRINDGNVEEISIFSVFRTPADLSGTGVEIIYEQGGGTNGINIYLQRDNSNPQIFLMMWENQSSIDYEYYASFSATASTSYMVQINYDGASSRVDYYQNNTLLGTTYDPNSSVFNQLNSHLGLLGIGALNNDSQSQGFNNLFDPDPGYYFTGEIAELILYDTYLNDAERNIIANYLGEKYGLTIGSDIYTDATYSYDVTGIGQTGTDTHLSGTGSGGGLSLEDNGSVNVSGEYVFAGHDNGSVDETFIGSPANITRLSRSWRVEETGAVDNIKLIFDLTSLGLSTPTAIGDYTLLYRANTGVDFTEVTTNISAALVNEVGTADVDVVFTLTDLNSGYFTIGVPLTNNSTPGQIPMAAGVLSSADDPGPVYWLEAGSSSLGLAGSSVTSWTDRIQEYVFAPQGASTTQPTLSSMNGFNALSFDGGDLLTIEEQADINGIATGPTELVRSDRTMFFVFETPSSISGPNCADQTDLDNYEVIYEQGGSGNGFNVYLNKCNGQIYVRAWEGANSTFGTFAATASTTYVVSLVYDADIGSNGTITFYNANQQLSTTTATWLEFFSRHTGDIGVGGVDNDSELIQTDETTVIEVIGDNLVNFNGKVAEVVFYDLALESAQHTIVNNYLGEKFGVTMLRDDLYSQPSSNNEVIGIGQADGDLHAANSGNGGELYLINEGGVNVDGEFVFAGHNGNTHGYTNNSAPTDASRWSRIWYIQKTGTINNVKLVFDTEGAGFGPADLNRVADDYDLLYRSGTTGTFTVVNASAKAIGDLVGSTDNDVIFSLTDTELQDGYYTLRVPRQIDWFTYNSGKWEDPTNWTLDPTGTRRLNPDNAYPSNDLDDADNVTVLNGDEILVDGTTQSTLNTDKGSTGLSLITLTIDDGGILDLGATTGHSALSIIGTGKIELNADNFISGDASGAQGFNTSDGGTVEFYGASGYDLSSAPTFNNMIVNMSGVALTLLSDLTLSGGLTVRSGTFQINNNNATNILNINAGKDVIVEAAGEISVGTGDAVSVQSDQTITFHQFNIVGDFTNTGTAIFHNIAPAHIADSTYFDYYPTASDPDDADQSIYASNEYGVVELLFNNATQDQNVVLNGTTEFYRIEVDKGISQTYVCEISASNTDNFKIYGRLAFRQEDDDLTDDNQIENPRALGLEGGILKLSDNIIVPEIAKLDQSSTYVAGNNDTEAGFSGGNRNYVIDNDAQLWISSNAQVIHNYGWGIHIFGTLKITDDGFYGFTELQPNVEGGSSNEASDILIDVAGVFEQSGGDVNTTQFRTKIGGSSIPRGSFILTGGVFNVGNGLAAGGSTHAVFSIPWPEMQFKMTGDGPGDDPVLNLNLVSAGKSVSAADEGLGVPSSVTAAWQVSSSEGNYEVTAGTVNINNASGINQGFGQRNYLIASTAPFYNLNLFRNVVPNEGQQSIWLAGVEETAEDATPTSGAQEARDLIVLNNFSLTEDGTANGGTGTSNTELHLFGRDLYVGGDFTFTNSDSELHTDENGGSSIIFNGSGNQFITIDEGDFNGTANNGATSGAQNVTFTGGGIKSIVIDNAFNGDNLNILGDLAVTDGVTVDLGGHAFTLNGNATNSGEFINTGGLTSGKVELTGGAGIHSIGGDGTGIFNNLELDDALGATLTSDITINGNLTMTAGLLDLETSRLTIDGASGAIVPGGVFNNTFMIATAGNATDGGLRLYFDADETLTFPLGIEGTTDYYLPATVDLSLNGATASYITINPVEGELGTASQTSGDALQAYWNMTHEFSGSPTVNSLTFSYEETLVEGTEANYVAGQVLDVSPFTRSGEDFDSDGTGSADLASVDEASNVIVFDGDAAAGFTILNANYSAGEQAVFLGAPRVFYNTEFGTPFGNYGKWNNPSKWSTEDHFSAVNTFNDFPKAGDVVIMSNPDTDGGGNFSNANTYDHYVEIDSDVACAAIVFSNSPEGAGSPSAAGPRLLIGLNVTADLGVISGSNAGIGYYLSTNSANNPVVSGDFNAFNIDLSNQTLFFPQNGSGIHDVPSNLTVFPNARIHGGGGSFREVRFVEDVTINGNLRIDVSSQLTLNNGANGDITVSGNTQVGPDSRGGRLVYPADGQSRKFSTNNLVIRPGSNATYVQVESGGATSTVHELEVRGDVTIQSGNDDYIDLFTNGTGGANVILTLSGDGVDDFWQSSNTSGADELYQLVLNKGTAVSNTFSLRSNIAFPDPSVISGHPVEIVNGTLVMDDPGLDITVANDDSGDFLLPNVNNGAASSGSGALEVRQGTVRIGGTATGLILNGSLVISGGEVLLNGGASSDNYIEYGASGDAAINLSSGVLFVGSQVRQNLISTTGQLDYVQTGGTAVFGVNSAPIDSKGVFEVQNVGSSFTLNNNDGASTFAIVGAQANPTLGTLIIGSLAAVDIATDAIIDIGYSNASLAGIAVSTDATNSFKVNIGQQISGLRIDNTNSNSPVVDLFINPLNLSGNLEILNNGTFDAQGLAVNIEGNFVNDGSFISNNNTTTFNGDVQTTSGTSTTTFHRLVSSATTSLTLGQAIAVDDDLTIERGTLNDSGNEIELRGDLIITTEHQGTGGINFNGAAKQEIFLPDDLATVENMVINNSNTVELGPLSTNVALRIDGTLELNSLFLIGDNRLIMSPGGNVTTGLSDFSKDVMISCNGSQADDGFEIEFLNGDLNFTLPVGIPDKYLPVTFNFSSDETALASLLVRPIQPTTYPFFSMLDGAGGPTDGQTNTLPYYWLITSMTNDGTNDLNNFSSISDALILQYRDEDIRTEPSDEAAYRPARLNAPFWSKLTSADKVDDALNQIQFEANDLGAGPDVDLTGFYTAGDPNDIPNELAQYISFINNSNWNNTATWRQDTDYSGDIDATEDDTPVIPEPGSIVIIDPAHTVNLDIDDLDNFSTQIDGTLNVGLSEGHYLGITSGGGTISVEQQLIPAFDVGLSTFFTTSGGELDFTGANSYTISSNFTAISGLRLSGGGTKTLPAIDYQIGAENLEIADGTTMDNAQNDNSLTISSDILITNGTLLSGNNTATLSAQNLVVSAAGLLTATGARFDLSGNLELAGGTINAGSSTFNLEGDLIRSSGTFNDETSTIEFDGSGTQLITGDFTSTNTLRNVIINNSGTGDVIRITGNSDVEIANRLTLTDGRVLTDANNTLNITNTNPLAINNSIAFTGFSDASYINGPLSRQMLESTSPYPFPVGDGGNNGYMEVRDPADYTGGTNKRFEVEYFAATPPLDVNVISADADAIGVQSASSVEYWSITVPSAATSEVGLYWDEFSGVTDANDIRIVWLNDPDGDPTTLGDNGDTEEWDLLTRDLVTGTASEGFVSSSERLSYSTQFVTLATTNESSSPLPVEMLYFTGEDYKGEVQLDWATSTEVNNDFFEVHRSQDGVDWNMIGIVSGAGTTVEEQTYDFSDFKPHVGNSYYRLRQVDFDGQFEYSEIILVQVALEPVSFNVYPNSFRDHFNVDVKGISANEQPEFSLVSLQGQVVSHGFLQADEAGRIDQQISFNSILPSGLYILMIETSQQLLKQNLIKR